MSAPFGIEIHSNLDGLNVEQDLGGGKYRITPPRPHPSFTDYFLQHSRTYGVVWVKGISPAFESDSYGNGVCAALGRISGQLEGRYGSPRKVDLLAFGALWEERRDWVMSILQNERSFFHIWERGKAQNLPDDLASVFLGILAHNQSDSSVILEYSSANFDAAEREADEDLADLL